MLYSHEAGVNVVPNNHTDRWEGVMDKKRVPPYKRERDGEPFGGAPLLNVKRTPPSKRDKRGKTPAGVTTLDGLAATVPHRANVVITSGGGYGPASGEGGSPGEGETAVTITFGSSYKPVGRNTSPIAQTMKGKAEPRRVKYQPSMQGARISRGGALTPISRGSSSSFPAGGLFDAGVSGFFGDAGRWIYRRIKIGRRRKKPEPANPPQSYPGPGYVPLSGLADVGDLGLSFKKITRWQPIPKSIRKEIPKPIRKGVKYYGAATQTIFFPVLSGPSQRRIFGLDAKESRVFMKGQQISRAVIATIATAGAAKYAIGTSTAAKPAVASGMTSGKLSLLSPGWTTGGIPGASAALPGSAQVATAAQIGGTAQGASVLGAVGKVALPMTKAITEAVLPLMLIKAMTGGAPGGGAEPGYSEVAPQISTASYGTPEPSYAGAGAGGGGYSEGGAPIEAGISTPAKILLAGVAVTGGVYLYKRFVQ